MVDLRDEDEPKVLSCSNGGECTPFISRPSTRTSWTPTGIVVDDDRELVLVGDSDNTEIHAFDFSGNVIHSIGTPLATSSMAFRPGQFAPLTVMSLETTSPTTTSSVVFQATSFRDRLDEPLSNDAIYSHFAVEAVGEISEIGNVVTTATITGDVSVGEGGEVEFVVDVPITGEWTFNLVDKFNDEYEEHIGGSPYTIFVGEGDTDPDACEVEFMPSASAGEEFWAVVKSFDRHGNPTVHASDSFRFSLNGGGG